MYFLKMWRENYRAIPLYLCTEEELILLHVSVSIDLF